MWKSEIFLQKIYRATLDDLVEAAAVVEDESFLEEEIKENIEVYLKTFYDDRMCIGKDTIDLDVSREENFRLSLEHDNIDPNYLQSSHGIFLYEPFPLSSSETEASSSAQTGAGAVDGGQQGPSTPPPRKTYKIIETPEKEKYLEFLDVGSRVSGSVHYAYALISSNYTWVYILVYYSFSVDENQRSDPNIINKLNVKTSIAPEILRDASVVKHQAVYRDNIEYNELKDLIEVDD
tara:strand:+ start:1516 stop:2220 length:705 start_codon:yes stop_codon:yes gene_type:complete